jgi:hypothetical protein
VVRIGPRICRGYSPLTCYPCMKMVHPMVVPLEPWLYVCMSREGERGFAEKMITSSGGKKAHHHPQRCPSVTTTRSITHTPLCIMSDQQELTDAEKVWYHCHCTCTCISDNRCVSNASRVWEVLRDRHPYQHLQLKHLPRLPSSPNPWSSSVPHLLLNHLLPPASN